VGCLGKVVLVILAVVAAWFIWDGVAGAIFQARGREIRQLGTEYVDALNSYGPVEPATGRRTLSRLSDLWEDDTDPTAYWRYTAGGVYPIKPTEGQLTQREAYEAFCQYLLNDGWTRLGEVERDTETVTGFNRGSWGLNVSMTDKGNWCRQLGQLRDRPLPFLLCERE
jgi:hypothetical protein